VCALNVGTLIGISFDCWYFPFPGKQILGHQSDQFEVQPPVVFWTNHPLIADPAKQFVLWHKGIIYFSFRRGAWTRSETKTSGLC
jgi:hypothetical protein